MSVFNILSQMHRLCNNREKEGFLFSNEVKAKSLTDRRKSQSVCYSLNVQRP
jgi:hypothetical protein